MRIERQLSIDAVSERLGLSRSTIYYWVRDLPIPGSGAGGGFAESARRKGNLAMQRKYRKLRKEAYQRGLAEFDELAEEATFRDFVSLYIAEGYKRDRNTVSICNSDSAVMRIAARWFCRLTDKTPEFRIQHHADQNLDELRRFWSRTLCIEPDAIKFQSKSNSNQLAGRSWRSRYGVLTMRIADTLLRARLQAWMDRIREDWR